MKKISIIFLMLVCTIVQAQEKSKQDSLAVVDEVLDEAIVKAVRVNEESPITYSNLDKTEIAKRNLGQDIPVLMNFMPSVVSTSDAGAGIGYTGIRVRGSDATRVNVTINGIPYNDSESMGTFWVNLPDFASSLEDLQLQRGVGTSTNGAGAFGASLNLLTDVVAKEANGELSVSAGSYNTLKTTAKFSTGLLNEHIELAGRFSYIRSDGYIDRASSDLKSYFLQGSYIDDNTLIKVLAFGGAEETYQAWYGTPLARLEDDEEGIEDFIDENYLSDEEAENLRNSDRRYNYYTYDNEVDHYNQDHYQLHWNQKYDNYWSSNIALHYTYGRGYFEQYKHDEDFADYGFEPIIIGGETIDTTDLIRRRWLDNDFFGTTFSVVYENNDDLEVIFGGAWNKYLGDHYGEVIWARYASDSEIRDRYYEDYGNKIDFNTYAKATYKLNDKFLIYGDLQLRTVSYEADGVSEELVDDKFTFFNPKAGVTYKSNENNSFYFSYARANREPNRTDYENGNPKPEALNDFELGWRLNKEKFNINSNLYYMRYNDQLVLTGELDDVGAPIRANVGDSYRLGLEFDAYFKLSDKFSIQPNIALSTNKNIDFSTTWNGEVVELGNTNISYSPNVIVGNLFNYHPTEKLLITFMSKYVGEQYMSNLDTEGSILDSYFINDLSINYEIKPKKVVKSIMISGLINNIFDVEYVSNGYYYTYDDTWSVPGETTTIEGAGYYPQATRNFLLGVTILF